MNLNEYPLFKLNQKVKPTDSLIGQPGFSDESLTILSFFHFGDRVAYLVKEKSGIYLQTELQAWR